MRVVPDAKAKTIVAFAKGNVEPRSLILSDDLSSYDSLTHHGYRHRVVTSASLDRIHMSFGNLAPPQNLWVKLMGGVAQAP